MSETVKLHGELDERADGSLRVRLHPGIARARRENYLTFIDDMRQQGLMGVPVDVDGLRGTVVSVEGLAITVEYNNFLAPVVPIVVQGVFLRIWMRIRRWWRR